MAQTVKVSVVIPMFNSSAFIASAIESVARQAIDALEVIIVDDNSTDNSISVAEIALLENGLRGRVIPRPKSLQRGAASCRNLGAHLAAGELLAFLDSDDAWVADHLERASGRFAEFESELIAYSSSVTVIDERGALLGTLPDLDSRTRGLSDVLPLLLKGMFLPTPTLCVRKADFLRTSGFGERMDCYEDWFFVLQLASLGNFYLDPVAGCIVLARAGSLSRSLSADRRGLAMSSAMYRDQLTLFADVRRKRFLSKVDLGILRTNVLQFNITQLSNLICGGRLKEAMRIIRALGNPPAHWSLTGEIYARVAVDVLARGVRRAARLSQHAL
jgi:glycosyltransferase involved in cell wall biosynthesis